MKKYPLKVYVTGVAIVWAFILGVIWSLGDMARFQTFALLC